jgi:hypothetical protein
VFYSVIDIEANNGGSGKGNSEKAIIGKKFSGKNRNC